MQPLRFVKVSVEEGVGILQLDHPEKRNALGWELHEEIVAVLRNWEADETVACALIIGNEDYFCSGWRLDILNSADAATRRKFNDAALLLMRTIYDFGKPSIAAVAGMAPGYGMDVANMCDITVASENAAFGSTQVKYAMNGFFHALASRVGRQNACRMYFTGDPVSANEALRMGLVSEVVPYGTLRSRSLELARQVAEMGPELAVVFKGVALRASNMDHLGALAFELSVTQDLLQRDIFRERISRGYTRMKAHNSAAVERMPSSAD